MKSLLRLKNSKILLIVTGGIAIYKSADLLRRLTQNFGAEVQVVMTTSAQKFMTPLIFETLSGKNVFCEMFEGEYVGTRHIDLAKEADLILVCPATANIIAKTAHGIADDLVSSVILAGWKKTVFAPAMNVNMWENPATQNNLEKLGEMGMRIIAPVKGLLACNDIGTGKLANIDDICNSVEKLINGKSLLKDKKVIITAGPTREKIDSVRFISNYSTGKMGLALALEAQKEDADVTLIIGPVNLDIPQNIKTIVVESAVEMQKALLDNQDNVDYLFMSAAVEDFIPTEIFQKKLKKNNIPDSIEIKMAPDIVASFRKKHNETCIVGFSVEIENGKSNSIEKMNKKGLDFIIWNNPEIDGAGFGHDTNEVTIFSKENKEWFLPKNTKRNIAYNIIKLITGK